MSRRSRRRGYAVHVSWWRRVHGGLPGWAIVALGGVCVVLAGTILLALAGVIGPGR